MEVTIMNNSIHPILILLASLGYCYTLVTKIPQATLKLISLLPVFYFFSILPWYFSSSFLRGIISFFITWIASFKLLLFCFNRGPLVTHTNYIDFIVLAIFPVRMKVKSSPLKASMDKKSLLKLLGALVPLLVTFFMHKDKNSQLLVILHGVSIFYGFYVIFTNDPAMARYELMQIFNKPYLAISLKEFWGRRWNRYSSYILRLTIYEPTQNSLKGVIGIGQAKVVALISTLVVSGVMHEMLFYYITCGRRPTWEVTWFFLLHGLCMIFEAGSMHFFRVMGWTLVHPAVSVSSTLGFVLVTFYWLLALPVWRNGQNICELR
ncbi:MBOAT_2 domain-containing protein [Cephalotus follicularis]|uniref:MBOAT_2 domain-containing protein n=1 Tax=Cephalotus follicularis TaxID=3775 RepID=A0A1Q3BAY4_CEPFO|nr:MBOAT_2 domain-containing protein [Cephalotus follicularis]